MGTNISSEAFSQLKRFRSRVKHTIRHFKSEKTRFSVPWYNPFASYVRWSSEYVSETGFYRNKFNRCLSRAEKDLSLYNRLLTEKKFAHAAKLSHSIATHLRSASAAWNRYHSETIDGAKLMVNGLKGVSIISAGIVAGAAGGFLVAGTAIGASAGAISVGSHAAGYVIAKSLPAPKVIIAKPKKKISKMRRSVIAQARLILKGETGKKKIDVGKMVLDRYDLKGSKYKKVVDLAHESLSFHRDIISKKTKGIKNFRIKTIRTMQYLYRQMIFNYQGKRPDVIRLHVSKGVNCKGNTKGVHSFLTVGKRLPKNHTLIIYEYKKHWAPGVMVKKTNEEYEFWDLMEGKKYKKAPTRVLYARKAIAYETLTNMNEKPNVSRRSIIAVNAKVTKYPSKAPNQAYLKSPYNENQKDFILSQRPTGMLTIKQSQESSVYDLNHIPWIPFSVYLKMYNKNLSIQDAKKAVSRALLKSESSFLNEYIKDPSKIEYTLQEKNLISIKHRGMAVLELHFNNKKRKIVIIRDDLLNRARNVRMILYATDNRGPIAAFFQSTLLKPFILIRKHLVAFLRGYDIARSKDNYKLLAELAYILQDISTEKPKAKKHYPFVSHLIKKIGLQVNAFFSSVLSNPRRFVVFCNSLSIRNFKQLLHIIRRLKKCANRKNKQKFNRIIQLITFGKPTKNARIIPIYISSRGKTIKRKIKPMETKPSKQIKKKFYKNGIYKMTHKRYLLMLFGLVYLQNLYKFWNPTLSQILIQGKYFSIHALKQVFKTIYLTPYYKPGNDTRKKRVNALRASRQKNLNGPIFKSNTKSTLYYLSRPSLMKDRFAMEIIGKFFTQVKAKRDYKNISLHK
ncbi:MAG: hypothetical protein ABIE74_10055 [Pseudomonadota bacterium]